MNSSYSHPPPPVDDDDASVYFLRAMMGVPVLALSPRISAIFLVYDTLRPAGVLYTGRSNSWSIL